MCAPEHLNPGPHGGLVHQIPPKRKLWVAVSHLTWVLESKLGSFGRAVPLLPVKPSLQPHRDFFMLYLSKEFTTLI